MVDENGRVSATTFLDALIGPIANEMVTRNGSIRKAYQSDRRWTKVLTRVIGNVCAAQLGCESVMGEFWPKVDIAAFDKCRDGNWHDWALDIAIEIENDSKDWEHECHKLMLLTCGLKVLISYYGDEKDLKRRVMRIPEVYESRKYGRINDEWLLLFLPWSEPTSGRLTGIAYRMFNRATEQRYETHVEELRRVDVISMASGSV